LAKAGERKVNRSCTYVRSDGRYVPGIIVSLGAGTAVDLRVGHHTGDTATDHANVAEMSDPSDTDVWLPGSRYRYP
jgi:hypothetical protein